MLPEVDSVPDWLFSIWYVPSKKLYETIRFEMKSTISTDNYTYWWMWLAGTLNNLNVPAL